MSHHTEAQVKAAFAAAPAILKRLVEAGVELPYFKLFQDASGTLVLADHVTAEQWDLAVSLVRSQRLSYAHRVAIDFCCGLVLYAEEQANGGKAEQHAAG